MCLKSKMISLMCFLAVL